MCLPLLPVRKTATAATCGSEVGSGTRRGKWKNFRTYYIYFSITFFFLSDFYSVTFFISLSLALFLFLFVLFSPSLCDVCVFALRGTLYSICFGNSLAQVLLNNKVDLHNVHSFTFDFVALRSAFVFNANAA